MRTANPVDIDMVMEDANAARNALPQNPAAIANSLLAQLVAAGIYGDIGAEEKKRAALAQAARDSSALRPFPMLPVAVNARFHYLRYIGQQSAAEEELRELSEQTQHWHVAAYYMLILYEQGDIAKALEAAEKWRGNSWVGLLRAFVIAETSGGPDRALQAYKDLRARYKGTSLEASIAFILPYLGRKADALAASLTNREVIAQSSFVPEFVQRQVDYACQLISADKLLKSAANDRLSLCIAHFSIALTKLADADRVGARDHFRKAIATRYFVAGLYDLSWAFLARMDKDPTWPPWIPLKKDEAKP